MQSISVGEAKSRFSSHNRQHFECVPGLALEDWLE
jgi:hypothetical protein